jgi:hypothetical protein
VPYSKLTGWDSGSSASEDEDSHQRAPSANARVVVLKYMFTLAELEEDATLLIDLKEEVREEAEGLGEVTNVTIYDVSLFSLICSAASDVLEDLIANCENHVFDPASTERARGDHGR